MALSNDDENVMMVRSLDDDKQYQFRSRDSSVEQMMIAMMMMMTFPTYDGSVEQTMMMIMIMTLPSQYASAGE